MQPTPPSRVALAPGVATAAGRFYVYLTLRDKVPPRKRSFVGCCFVPQSCGACWPWPVPAACLVTCRVIIVSLPLSVNGRCTRSCLRLSRKGHGFIPPLV